MSRATIETYRNDDGTVSVILGGTEACVYFTVPQEVADALAFAIGRVASGKSSRISSTIEGPVYGEDGAPA